jgi:membrane-associated phospholipid phosphatase
MSWKKKYAISCLIALFAFAAIDAYHHPGKDVRVGAVVVTAAVWPITLSIAFGSALGDMFASAPGEN